MAGSLIRSAALAGTGLLAAEMLLAILEPVPELPEFDASGRVGAGPPDRRWLALGDSTTTGPGLDTAEDIWITQLARRQGQTIDIVSLAKGGATSSSLLRDQIPHISGQFDLAFIAVGSNDALRGISTNRFRANLEEIVRAVRHHSRCTMLMGVGDLGTIPRLRQPLSRLMTARAARIDRVATDISAAEGILKADHWAFRNSFQDPEIFSVDRFHPTAAGHTVWADAVDLALGAAFAAT